MPTLRGEWLLRSLFLVLGSSLGHQDPRQSVAIPWHVHLCMRLQQTCVDTDGGTVSIFQDIPAIVGPF